MHFAGNGQEGKDIVTAVSTAGTARVNPSATRRAACAGSKCSRVRALLQRAGWLRVNQGNIGRQSPGHILTGAS